MTVRQPDETPHTELRPGDYCRTGGTAWGFRTPNGIYFAIDTADPRCHALAEHEDGSVTLSPSVACSPGSCGVAEGYHGHIERGVWRDA
jgi:hypothetical protein